MNSARLAMPVAAVFLLLLVTPNALALPSRAVPVQDVQPDGTPIDLWVSGDGPNRMVRDARGFTVVCDPVTGWRVYAEVRNGRPTPSALAVGIAEPLAAGLVPGMAMPSRPADVPVPRVLTSSPRSMPTAGEVFNLLVFVRFQDDDEMDESFEAYERQFESLEVGVPSMRSFFLENSGGLLDVRTLFLPAPEGDRVVAVTVPHSRAYYRVFERIGNPDGYKTESEGAKREQELWQIVLAAVAEQVPEDAELDADGDGWVDNIIFMVQGWPDAWSDVLWPHKWELWDPFELGNGKVRVFNLQFTTFMIISPGTFAHETFHSLGAPDLYHYSQDDLTPVGPWDPMEHTALEPQHFLAYMKWRYGNWIPEIPVLEAGGEVELHPSWDLGPQAVRVNVPESDDEHFILEYRRKAGTFESALPGSGVIVYRINTLRDGRGNRNGPPDEVYVLRPGGSPTKDGNVKNAFLSAQSGRTNVSAWSETRPFLSDGTDVTLRVYDVGEAGETIKFNVCLEVPDCGDRVCGDDGCGGLCGVCGEGLRCRDEEGGCEPCSCDGRACGDDGCGVSCGTCDDGNACTVDRCETFACVSDFAPEGTACDDGDDATVDDACDAAGVCVGVIPMPEPEPEPEPVPDALVAEDDGVRDPISAGAEVDATTIEGGANDATWTCDLAVSGTRAVAGGCAAGTDASGGAWPLLLLVGLLAMRQPRRRRM